MPKGSLEHHLFRSESLISLPISTSTLLLLLLPVKSAFSTQIYDWEKLVSILEQGVLTSNRFLGPSGWRLPLELPRVLRFFIVIVYKWYIETSKLLISYLIRWVRHFPLLNFDSWFLPNFFVLVPHILFINVKWQNYNAKLSDFGLAKDGPTGDKSHVSTRVMGTYGYAAPEYLATGDFQSTIWNAYPVSCNQNYLLCHHFHEGHLTTRSDVYSFGVVLLEMLSGRRAVDKNRPSGEHNLVEWARPYLASKRKIFHVLDSRIQGQFSLNGAHGAARVAIQCLSTEPKHRPNMDQVVTALEQLQADSNNTTASQNRPRPNFHNSSSNGPKHNRTAYPRPTRSPAHQT